LAFSSAPVLAAVAAFARFKQNLVVVRWDENFLEEALMDHSQDQNIRKAKKFKTKTPSSCENYLACVPSTAETKNKHCLPNDYYCIVDPP